MSKLLVHCLLLVSLAATSGHTQNWSEVTAGPIVTVTNKGGQTLGYATTSGVKLIIDKGLAFKDLNKNGKLDPYEDWRLPVAVRATDLASKMSIEQIAGLMLYSKHQPIPSAPAGPFAGTYAGKTFAESGAKPTDLSDQQKEFLTKDNVRHVLITSVQSPAVAAGWNNNAQALVEGLGLGIPANNSSDPRHGTRADAEYNAGAGGTISMWPGSLGLAATFNPDVVKQFGQVAAAEYRALGIATALSPQIDLATDPRWYRFSGTFGEDPKLTTDLARAYIDGFQTSTGSAEIKDGWGYSSVNAMVKHWPGGGSGESGRDAHYGYGKYAVYPGNNFATHFMPFTEGAFKLTGKTGMASAVMPYYTISLGQDKKNGENVGNSYNKYIITDLLRTKYGYNGVVCTDWNITADETAVDVFLTGKSWGVEKLSVAERHYKILMAGADQFGGNNDATPVIAAYQMGVKDLGEKAMRARMEQSAVRLLANIFRVGLFENPYLNSGETASIVGKSAYMQAGYQAQLQSVVLLKNKANALPLTKGRKVYIPKRFTPAGRNFLGMNTPEKLEYPVNLAIVQKYFTVTDNPDEADYALAFIRSPDSGGGYSSEDAKAGGNGYVPISLQYGDYTAQGARNPSLGGGDPLEKFTNRSYDGKSVKTINRSDLTMVTETYTKMKGKPVIVAVQMNNPTIFTEFDRQANAILAHFSVQDQALMDILTGAAEPSGLLPMQMPADMKTVEAQAEDVPRDMKSYVDSEGNTYDFAFGLNWKGVIRDSRTATYKKETQKAKLASK
ncbi:glycoside hydrolase family 3 N-terminal domain-containing protein [uncultured Fibrella sp.]|uniref:glycoside hydrolase family 3 protein n=1 Tax=uncultured Fibrella sp. TaxID=1284596 RepID=UPI0035CACC9D